MIKIFSKHIIQQTYKQVFMNKNFPFLLAMITTITLCIPCYATNKSGVTPNTISVPKGPGSIEGLGDSFQPTLNTGTAKYQVPLKLPPANYSPQILLRYDAGNPNSPFGFGWNINIPYIQRQTDKGIPRYSTTNPDTFIDHTKEELIQQQNGYYFHKNEGAFIRYERIDNYWEGTLPNGEKMIFGKSPQARLSDPSTGHIFKWVLEKQIDTSGNTIVYSYCSFDDETNTNQVYLSKIEYAAGAPPWNYFHFVSFEYEDRNDWFEDCRSGFVIHTGKRLTSILMGTQGLTLDGHKSGDFNNDDSIDYLNHKYTLAYDISDHWSLLSSITLWGADNQSKLPPVSFKYTVASLSNTLSASSALIGSINTSMHVMDNDLVDLLDINGDGLPDILKTEQFGGQHIAYLNMGENNESNTRSIQWNNAQYFSGDPKAQNINLQNSTDAIAHLADMNGDGLSDLVYQTITHDVYYFSNSGLVSWGDRCQMSIDSFESMPPSPFGSQHVKTADIDFDKRMDIIQSVSVGHSAYYRIWFNLGNQRYSKSVTITQPFGYMLSNTDVHIADMNGDRVPDIVRIRPTGIEVTTGLGHGYFADKQTIFLKDHTLTDSQIQKARLHDISGDGLLDLVIERAEVNRLWYWINLGNYTFDPKRIITDMPSIYGKNPTIRWADMNGNGTVDYVYADHYANPRIQIVDIGELIGCVPTPNLLTHIDNHIGRKISIQYKTSAYFAIRDAKQNQKWTDPLPSPVNVVSSFSVDDSLGNTYETNLYYHNGYYDVNEHEFRGFQIIDQIEKGDSTAPTLVTNFEYDTGRFIEGMKGKLLSQTLSEQGIPVCLKKDITEWSQPIELTIGINGQPVNFIHQVSHTVEVNEQGRGTPKKLYSEFEYDRYGNQTHLRNYGIVDEHSTTPLRDERFTITQYAYNTDKWLIRYPKQVDIRNGKNELISQTLTFYDDPTFSGNNLGSISLGKATLVRKMLEINKTIDMERFQYDEYGNPILLIDPLGKPAHVEKGHCRKLQYDSFLHSYPIKETIYVHEKHIPLVFQVDYDMGFGRIKSSTDFNTNITSYHYDTFGRLVSIVRPGDTIEKPAIQYKYYLGQSYRKSFLVNYVETILLDDAPNSGGYFKTRQFIDGLGRKLMTKTEAGVSGFAVNEAVSFNARKQKQYTLQPYYSQSFDYENIMSSDWQGQFHFKGKIVELNFSNAHKTMMYYDAMLRPVKILNPDNTVQKIEYEPLIKKSFDENDSDSKSPYYNTPMVTYNDGLGRLIQMDEIVRLNNDGTSASNVNSWTTRYEYRADDLLTKITDSQGNIKILQYDALKRKTFINDPDRGTMHYHYDDASNLIKTTDAKNQIILYTYDGANRLLTEDYQDSFDQTPDVLYHYDKSVVQVDFGNNSSGTSENTRGFLSYVNDLSGNEYISYDAKGRTKWIVKQIQDPLNEKLVSYKTEMTYDHMDRLKKLIYPDNDQCTYTYNTRNLLQRISGGAAHNNNATQYIISDICYSPSGQSIQTRFGNGMVTDYTYDSRLRISTLYTTPASKFLEPKIAYSYHFDNVSNIIKIIDHCSEQIKPVGDQLRNTQIFTYDDLYRINSVQYSHSLPGQNFQNNGEITYTYDPIGNMLSKTSDIHHEKNGKSITNIGVMKYAENNAGPHAITSSDNGKHHRIFSYDANGNMINIDGMICTWDFKDRLIEVKNKTIRASYTYDYTGRRISKKVWKIKNNQQDKSPYLTTIYVDKLFEVREGYQPIKYVFNSYTRVARIIGSLDVSSKRIQRFQLFKGWNLVTFAVSSNDSGKQFGIGADDNIEAVFKWLPDQKTYAQVDERTELSKGSILWVRLKNDAIFSIIGDYVEPPETVLVPAGHSVISPAALFSISSLFENQVKSAWLYSNQHQTWNIKVINMPFISELPDFLDVGQPVHFLTAEQTVLKLPKQSQRIQYYHPDHLGSSNMVTDGKGNIIDENVFYPFGHVRQHKCLDSERRYLSAKYMFTGKELDKESNLLYFEARYYNAIVGKFVSVDPIEINIGVPQRLNLYSYTLNNPIIFIDPNGYDSVIWVSNDIHTENKNTESYNTYKSYIFTDGLFSAFLKQSIASFFGFSWLSDWLSAGVLETTRNSKDGNDYDTSGSIPPTKNKLYQKQPERYEVRKGEVDGIQKYRIGDENIYTSRDDLTAIANSTQVRNPVNPNRPRTFLNFDPYQKPCHLEGCLGISDKDGKAFTGSKTEKFIKLNSYLETKIPDLKQVNKIGGQRVYIIVDHLFE